MSTVIALNMLLSCYLESGLKRENQVFLKRENQCSYNKMLMDHLRLLGNGAHSKYKLLLENIDNRLDNIYGLSDEDKGNVALQ